MGMGEARTAGTPSFSATCWPARTWPLWTTTPAPAPAPSEATAQASSRSPPNSLGSCLASATRAQTPLSIASRTPEVSISRIGPSSKWANATP